MHTHTHTFVYVNCGDFHRLLLLSYWPNNIFYPLTNSKPTPYRKPICIATISDKHNLLYLIIYFPLEIVFFYEWFVYCSNFTCYPLCLTLPLNVTQNTMHVCIKTKSQTFQVLLSFYIHVHTRTHMHTTNILVLVRQSSDTSFLFMVWYLCSNIPTSSATCQNQRPLLFVEFSKALLRLCHNHTYKYTSENKVEPRN